MGEFSYSAIGKDRKTVSGVLDGKDRSEILRILKSRGMQPISVRSATQEKNSPQRAVKKEKIASNSKSELLKVRLNSKQVILFTEELSDLLNAGVQMEPGLKLMENRGDLSAVGDVAGQIREKVRDGMSLARALSSTCPSFGELYCNLVSAGEVSGALPDILKRQIQYLTTIQELKGRVLTAMIYPAFLFLAGFSVTIMFVTFLIPRLTSLMESTEGSVPFGIQVIIGASEFIKAYWWALLAFIVVSIISFRTFIQNPKNRPWWDRVKLKIPLYGNIQKSQFHVQFLQTLGNMLKNGLTLVNALELCEKSTPNLFLSSQLKKTTAAVTDGASLHRSLDKGEMFPKPLIDLLRIGEQTGRLTESINKAGERYDRELARTIERSSAMIQPVIILMMAGIIGTMAYMMITVIYDTISVLRTR